MSCKTSLQFSFIFIDFGNLLFGGLIKKTRLQEERVETRKAKKKALQKNNYLIYKLAWNP